MPVGPRLLRRASGPLCGVVEIPGDKSISHRVVLLALLADGPCHASGWLASDDTLHSLAAAAQLGAAVTREGDRVTVVPPNTRPQGDLKIDCGNSGTTCRLLCGLLAGWLPQGATVTLTGDASLSRRPMARVVDPLRAMGADITCLGEAGRLPLRIAGAALHGCDHHLTVPSAQVKSALLLAGLQADGRTAITGGGGSRDHTERQLTAMGAPLERAVGGDGLVIGRAGALRPFDLRVPADPSTAAFFHVAAALVPGSDLLTPGLSLNPTRIGALQALRDAGAVVTVTPTGDSAGDPVGDVRVEAGPLRAFVINGPLVPSLVDEIPVLAVLAAAAAGETRISGAAELRVKESDRLALMAANLAALGVEVHESPDGLRLIGPARLRGGPDGAPLRLRTANDHRIAMAMAVAALISDGHSTLDDFDCVAVSFPQFFATLATLIDGGISDRPF